MYFPIETLIYAEVPTVRHMGHHWRTLCDNYNESRKELLDFICKNEERLISIMSTKDAELINITTSTYKENRVDTLSIPVYGPT